MITQFAFAASDVPHVLLSTKSPLLVPLMVVLGIALVPKTKDG